MCLYGRPVVDFVTITNSSKESVKDKSVAAKSSGKHCYINSDKHNII